jgi:hypothetical protein
MGTNRKYSGNSPEPLYVLPRGGCCFTVCIDRKPCYLTGFLPAILLYPPADYSRLTGREKRIIEIIIKEATRICCEYNKNLLNIISSCTTIVDDIAA